MKIKHLLVCALIWSMSAIADTPSKEWFITTTNREESAAEREWHMNEQSFYVLALPNGNLQSIVGKLHPDLKDKRETVAKLLIAKIAEKNVNGPEIAWNSKATIIKQKEGEERAPIPDAAMFVLMRFNSVKGKPAVWREEHVKDGQKETVVYNLTSPRLDLWVRKKGIWYIIPNEVLNLDASLQATGDMSLLIREITEK